MSEGGFALCSHVFVFVVVVFSWCVCVVLSRLHVKSLLSQTKPSAKARFSTMQNMSTEMHTCKINARGTYNKTISLM